MPETASRPADDPHPASPRRRPPTGAGRCHETTRNLDHLIPDPTLSFFDNRRYARAYLIVISAGDAIDNPLPMTHDTHPVAGIPFLREEGRAFRGQSW